MTASHLWAIVLGGRRHGRRPHGCPSRVAHDRPAPAARTGVFRQAVERAARIVDTEHLVAVLDREHLRSYDIALATPPGIQRVVQPLYRGTAPEVFLPLLKIIHQDPEALVVILPGDHRVEGEARLMTALGKAVQAAERRPGLPLVIGAQPTLPDPRAAWIEPGVPIEDLAPFGVRAVARFVTRPGPADLTALWEGDGLINTRIVVGKARTLIRLGRRYLPDVLEAFEPLTGAFGAPEEALLCEAVYEEMPYASMAHALFVRAHRMAVVPVAHVTLRTREKVPGTERLAS